MSNSCVKLNGFAVLSFASVFLIGVLARISISFSSDFPINDGGMFYAMTNDLVSADFKLPFYTTYNQTNIPFAYPPLGFYFVGLISTLTGVELIYLFRFFPLVITILTIPLFYLFAWQVFSQRVAVYSTVFFSLAVRSFRWQIMGGGVARSLGMLFLLAGIYLFQIYSERKSSKLILALSIVLALTILSHLEWSFFLLVSLFLLALGMTKPRQQVLTLFKLAIISLFLTLPWWFLNFMRHGPSVYWSFFLYGVDSFSLFSRLSFFKLRFLDEVLLIPVLGIMVLVSSAWSVLRKHYWLALWLFLPLLLTPRNSPNLVVIPASLLVGKFLEEAFTINLSDKPRKKFNKSRSGINGIKLFGTWSVFLATLVFLTLNVAVFHEYLFPRLVASDRQVMLWAKERTKEEDRFLIIGRLPYHRWATDNFAEWFPALSERQSVLTPQGAEWLPNNRFEKLIAARKAVKLVATSGKLDLMEAFLSEHSLKYDYLILDRGRGYAGENLELLEKAVIASPLFQEVYNQGGIKVYKRN